MASNTQTKASQTMVLSVSHCSSAKRKYHLRHDENAEHRACVCVCVNNQSLRRRARRCAAHQGGREHEGLSTVHRSGAVEEEAHGVRGVHLLLGVGRVKRSR